MPISKRRLTSLVQRHAGTELAAQALRFEDRYQEMAVNYFQAKEDFSTAQQHYLQLHAVVQAKQDVIEVLLPYYPHPLTPELRYKMRWSRQGGQKKDVYFFCYGNQIQRGVARQTA